jgi:dihydroorotate dehydrogenase (fumarate)
MVTIRSITVSPPLINTACAWASDEAQLAALFDCPYTGAVTTRTATLGGFNEDASHTVTPSPRSPITH